MKSLRLHFLTGILIGALPLPLAAQVVLTGELLTNPGAETGNITGWTVVGGGGNTNPHADNGTYDLGYNPRTGSYQFVGDTYPGGGGAQGYLRQTIDLTAIPGFDIGLVDAGSVAARVSFWETTYFQGSSPDSAGVALRYLNASAQAIGNATTPILASQTSSGTDLWANHTGDYGLPVGTRSIEYTMAFFRGNNGGNYIDAFIDDNSLKLVSVPEPGEATALGAAGLLMFALWRRRR